MILMYMDPDVKWAQRIFFSNNFPGEADGGTYFKTLQ